MRDKILIVDDIDVNRDMLAMILEDNYRILFSEDGESALAMIESHREELAAVLLDLIMPKMDGIEVLKRLQTKKYMNRIPVLVISSDESVKSERQCFKLGVCDFIRKPFDKELVRTRVTNIVNLYLYKQYLEERVDEQTKIIEKRNSNMLDLLANVVETRDLESGEHIQRVKGYTEILAKQLMQKYPKYKLDEKKIEVIVAASALHDVGKIAISDSILLKPGKLTKEEFDEMKKHTTRGGELIRRVQYMWDDEYGKASYEICLYHHEKYDGRGYPAGLVGDDIPISAQIVSVADVYDALISKRCYKDAYEKRQAYQMILNGECGQFNPDILDCFIEKIEELEFLANQLN